MKRHWMVLSWECHNHTWIFGRIALKQDWIKVVLQIEQLESRKTTIRFYYNSVERVLLPSNHFHSQYWNYCLLFSAYTWREKWPVTDSCSICLLLIFIPSINIVLPSSSPPPLSNIFNNFLVLVISDLNSFDNNCRNKKLRHFKTLLTNNFFMENLWQENIYEF